MLAYTVILAGVGAWGARWKGKAAKAQDALKAKALELERTQESLINMGAKVVLWKSQAAEQGKKAAEAQAEAQRLRTEYESKAQAVLQTHVADKDAAQFLRDEASK